MITNADYIGKSVKEQIITNTSSYLHCSMCGCKIDDVPGKGAAQTINGHIYCGAHSNGCKYKVKLKKCEKSRRLLTKQLKQLKEECPT